MKKILVLLIALAILAGCNPQPRIATYQVTGSGGLLTSQITWASNGTMYLPVTATLPWNQDVSLHAGTGVLLTADTGTATSGTLTATILIDGAIWKTASATAVGVPAQVTIFGTP